MGLQELVKDADSKLLQAIHKIDTNFNERMFNYIKFAETGDIGYLKKQMELLRGKDQSTEKKENIEPSTSTLSKRTTRQNSTVTDNTNFVSNPKIKLEKLSLVTSTSGVSRNESDDMPAPTMLPPRKRKIKEERPEAIKRSTRTNTRKNYEEELKVDRGKPSDVIIQNTTVTMIDITEDKDTDVEPVISSESTRSTRTKTRQQKIKAEVDSKDIKNKPSGKTKQTKRQIKASIVEETTKRSNSSSDEKEENKSAQTEYEDAVSNLENNDPEGAEIPSSTMVAVPTFDKTMVVEKPTIVQNDDHSQWKTPPKTKSKKQQTKEIFSPYGKTSTKKKVEAFEKLGSASKNTNSTSKIPVAEDQNSEVKTKHYTPFGNKFLPKSCSTTRVNRMTPTSQSSSSNDSCLSTKTLSALKASQAEYREREKRRQEKEQDAQLKKEALLQAQAEEKRRKREERQLKVQQQRELIKKEKEKLLEMQKLKQDKNKQVIAETEERLKKTREEAEKQGTLPKIKAKIAKQGESSSVAESGQTKTAQIQNTIPIYMMTKAPLLPTDDCYDSDDELRVEKGDVRPEWSKSDNLKRQLYTQLVAGEKIKNSLFCCQTRSPDLTEIFETIDPRKLKRTSSAVWRKPPRYTLFSTTNDIHFSEDSD